MKYRIPFYRPLVAALVMVVAACADSATPTAPRALEGNVSASVSSLTQRMLDAQLEAAKRRIDLAKKTSDVISDSLKRIWDTNRPSNSGSGNGSLSFMMCDPVQYAGEAKIIGPEGGEIGFGPHKLRIPVNALKVPTVITAEAPPSLTVEAQLGPHGLEFDARYPANLELNYKHCLGLPRNLLSKKIVYVNDLYEILEVTLSEDKKDRGLVNGKLFHFSGYIVAW